MTCLLPFSPDSLLIPAHFLFADDEGERKGPKRVNKRGQRWERRRKRWVWFVSSRSVKDSDGLFLLRGRRRGGEQQRHEWWEWQGEQTTANHAILRTLASSQLGRAGGGRFTFPSNTHAHTKICTYRVFTILRFAHI